MSVTSTLASSSARGCLDWREPFAAGGMAAAVIGLILIGAGRLPPAPMDQAFANVDLHPSHASGYWEFHYPVLSYAGGISASLIVGVYKLLAPVGAAHLNYHVKILAGLYFLATTQLLARAVLAEAIDRVAALGLVASSGLTFLEPSSEVLAGGAANLFVWLWLRDGSGLLAGAALAIFALIKIELVAVAGVMLICALAWKPYSKWRRIGLATGCFAGLAVLASPDVYLYGWRGAFLGREFDAFGAHYCALFHDQFSAPACRRIFRKQAV